LILIVKGLTRSNDITVTEDNVKKGLKGPLRQNPKLGHFRLSDQVQIFKNYLKAN